MKFTGSIEINQPLDVVVSLFADPDNLGEYQDGFLRKELVSGTQGEDGAVSKLYYSNRGRDMELTEPIVQIGCRRALRRTITTPTWTTP